MGKKLQNLDELTHEARVLSERLAPKTGGATLVTLSGELGAGKTSFTQALAKMYGIEEHVTSPTFVLEKVYQLAKDKSFRRLVHIDAYRLKSGEELSALGWDELMKDARTLVVLEWPEMVADGLPKADVAILLTVEPDQSRTIAYA
ncbi:MAG: tRNA (adenosine(37)-N6)-threonylcarbamoyltransferase complex ATPase subunit type 1 TsaE [Patescibacteria group bacterium]